MNFIEYQKYAERTSGNLDEKLKYANFGMGLTGEAGEVCEILKKHVFHERPLDKEWLKEELGDVLWYISSIARVADISLDDIATTNIEKLKKRYPNGSDYKIAECE